MGKIFQLKKPLLLDNPNGVGQLYFSPFEHAFDYRDFSPNGKEQTIDVNLVVTRIDNPKAAHVLKTFRITPDGYEVGSATNLDEIDDAKAQKASLETDVAASKSRLEQLIIDRDAINAIVVTLDGKELDKKLEELKAKLEEIEAEKLVLADFETQLAAVVIPAEHFNRAFTYAQVVQFFKNDGTIVDAALPAVMMIPYEGRPMADWVEIIER
jgi:hypothetical protein